MQLVAFHFPSNLNQNGTKKLAACKEALDISEGRIPAKRYDSWEEAVKDLELSVAEQEPEYGV